MVFEDLNRKSDYATGGQTRVPIYITGDIKVGNAEVAILDSDLGSIETKKTYVYACFHIWSKIAYLIIDAYFMLC